MNNDDINDLDSDIEYLRQKIALARKMIANNNMPYLNSDRLINIDKWNRELKTLLSKQE